MYAVAKTIALVLLPPSGPLVVILAGLVLFRTHERRGRILVTLGAVTLWLTSTPIIVSLLIMKFGSERAVDPAQVKQAQAIVILAGGIRRAAPEYGGTTVGRLTLERVRYGAVLARQTGLPILVTGGTPLGAPLPEAELMRQVLEVEFGTRVRWVESQSANTHENATNSAALLRQDGISRVVLVTHAFDAPRARHRFEQAKMEVVSAPTQVPGLSELGIGALLPSTAALSDFFFLGYEALAWIADSVLPGR